MRRLTAIERRYQALVDEFGELELSPTRFPDVEHSIFEQHPSQSPDVVQAPLAYQLVETPGLELRARPLLILTLLRVQRGRTTYYYHRFTYRLGPDLVPDVG